MKNLHQVLDQVSKRIQSMQGDKKAISEYLDLIESMIPELPYGDIVYEHAWEIAQSVI